MPLLIPSSWYCRFPPRCRRRRRPPPPPSPSPPALSHLLQPPLALVARADLPYPAPGYEAVSYIRAPLICFSHHPNQSEDAMARRILPNLMGI